MTSMVSSGLNLSTNYPKDMTTPLLEAIRDLPKVSHYLHVPLQHGSDDVLKRMKRGYTVQDYRDMMERIAITLPQAAVSSDFIVGFCGETEEEHQLSLELMEECRFKNSFIFKYSERPGTKASERLPDDIPDEVKKRRNNELLAVQNRVSEELNQEFVGQEVEVLVEGISKATEKAEKLAAEKMAAERMAADPVSGLVQLTVSGDLTKSVGSAGGAEAATEPEQPEQTPQLVGRTMCDRIVVFDGNPRLAGSVVSISVHDCTPTTLLGSIVTKEVQHGATVLSHR